MWLINHITAPPHLRTARAGKTQLRTASAENGRNEEFIVDWTRVAMARIKREMCINFAQLYLRNGYDEQNKSIATRTLYVNIEFEAI